jgi:hypothetical protein
MRPLLGLPAWVVASPAMAQARLGGGGSLDLSLTRIGMALILCLMLAALAVLLIKRSGGRVDLSAIRRRLASTLPQQRRIDVIESRRVSLHADICLVRCDSREYLILCAPQQQTVLRETDVAGADT